MGWTAANPTSVGAATKKDHYNKLWDNAQELADIFTAITNGTIGTTDPGDFRVDAAGLATDAVETAKIKDANVDKDKINADVVGTGLAGGAGTALSVDGIVEGGASAELKVKIVDIGAWNMDSTDHVDIAHGLTLANIRNIQVSIKQDSNLSLTSIFAGGAAVAGYWLIDATNVKIYRINAGIYDSANFDSTTDPANRGWVTIWYEA